MSQPFALDHESMLAAFQTGGEDRFVWGFDRSADQMFFLPEDQAKEHRAHVTEHVVCPVPGCEAALTTVHSTVKRDHLRHLGGTGGHGLESFFHAQGCALIQAWLSEEYPLCHVKREEYTNAQGERRADVLITSPDGSQRVAFEVQYSPLTHDAWTERHESYRSQGIDDVWLFGHTDKQLKLDQGDRLKSNPALSAVAATGAPVLFINPALEQLAIAISDGWRYSWKYGWLTDPSKVLPVPILDKPRGAHLEVHSLREFRLGARTLTSDRLDELVANRVELEGHNADQIRVEAITAEKSRIAEERRRAESAQRLERAKTSREELIAAIRVALDDTAPWAPGHPAFALIARFIENRDRRDLFTTSSGSYERWKCAAYFLHIAGRQDVLFGTKDVASSLRAHGVRLEPGIYKVIGRWLHGLVDGEFLYEARDKDGYPVYKPTFSGVWW